jgi:hypothetical protein
MPASSIEFVEFEIAPTEIPRQPPIGLGNSRFVLQELDCGKPMLSLHFRQGSLINLLGLTKSQAINNQCAEGDQR